jgi:hypothetical protein
MPAVFKFACTGTKDYSHLYEREHRLKMFFQQSFSRSQIQVILNVNLTVAIARRAEAAEIAGQTSYSLFVSRISCDPLPKVNTKGVNRFATIMLSFADRAIAKTVCVSKITVLAFASTPNVRCIVIMQ